MSDYDASAPICVAWSADMPESVGDLVDVAAGRACNSIAVAQRPGTARKSGR
jgi:hypothetical protein